MPASGCRSRCSGTRRRRQFEHSSSGRERSAAHAADLGAFERHLPAGAAMTHELVLVEREQPIAVVRLNRPDRLNALSDELMDELVGALTELDRDEAVRCIVVGGSERAFAAGADIGELARSSAIELYYQRRGGRWGPAPAPPTPPL